MREFFVKPGSFIDNYMQYLNSQETPVMYDMMSAYWILGCVLGREVIVDRPRAPVHMNSYMILVSESGIMRKSTSIRLATGLLRDYFSENNTPHVMLETRFSTGALFAMLTEMTRKNGHAHAIVVASELAAVLNRSAGASVPAVLTDLYDCPDVRIGGSNIKDGGFNFRNVYLSFIAGSTPVWLARAVRPEVVEGGFTSRCYFVQGRNRKRLVPWPDAADDTRLRTTMLQQLKDIANDTRTYARIGINSQARDTFASWYGSRDVHKDAYRESFESREDAHVLRFAGLAAANEQTWTISDDYVRRGINIVAELKRYGANLFTTDAGIGKASMRLAERLRTRLLIAGDIGIGRRELYRALAISGRQSDEFRTLLRLFHELDLCKVFSIEETGGRPREQYVATEYLKNEQFLEDVANKLGVQ